MLRAFAARILGSIVPKRTVPSYRRLFLLKEPFVELVLPVHFSSGTVVATWNQCEFWISTCSFDLFYQRLDLLMRASLISIAMKRPNRDVFEFGWYYRQLSFG